MKNHPDHRSMSRRRFLRGSGVVLATPWFASLAGRTTVAATEDKTDVGDPEQAPLRTAFLYFPNGVWEKDWVPASIGREFALPPSLLPLEPIRDQVSVLSGLDKMNSHGGDGHYAKTANFLTGMPVAKTTGKDISSGGVSVDQLIASHIGDRTPLPSLELGTEPVISGIDSNVGYTRLYGSHISWETPTRPVAKEINPRVVYERLFGNPLGSNRAEADSYQNLLDYVLEDARSIRKTLGRDDQFKMDEYLDALRAVEKRIEYASRSERDRSSHVTDPNSIDTIPSGTPQDFREHIEVMLDLIALAFQTDSTRVCSFMFANDVSGRNFSFLDGVQGAHHELSHHENKVEKISQYQLINQWHVEQFVRLITKLKGIQEGDGTLLDHCMIMFGSSFSDGNRHDPDNLPILLAGSGNGALNPGVHLAASGQVPLCNLYLTMLHKQGIELESFGDSNGELAGL